MDIDSVHQTGPAYRSNNAGDGPEKTRDRKSWFPRFKSNWLGTFRSKQMFLCCECAVASPSSGSPTLEHQQSAAARYKGAEGKHCLCGRDQWHLAKAIEEAEYNRRMEISKALGGMRYDEAAVRLRSLGVPESDLDRIRDTFAAGSAVLMNQPAGPQPRHARGASAKRSRASSVSAASSASRETDAYSSPLSSASTLSSSSSPSSLGMSTTVPMAVSYSFSTQHHHYPQASYSSQPAMKDYASPYTTGGYSPLHVDYSNTHGAGHGMTAAGYDHYVTAAFTDEEGFGELLQGILEDEPRQPVGSSSSAGYASSRQSLPPPSRMGNFSAGMPLGSSVMTSASTLSAPVRPTHAFPGAPMVPEHDHSAAYYSHVPGRSSSGQYGGVVTPSSSSGSTSMPMASRFLPELPPYGAGRSTPSYAPPATAMAAASGYTTIV